MKFLKINPKKSTAFYIRFTCTLFYKYDVRIRPWALKGSPVQGIAYSSTIDYNINQRVGYTHTFTYRPMTLTHRNSDNRFGCLLTPRGSIWGISLPTDVASTYLSQRSQTQTLINSNLSLVPTPHYTFCAHRVINLRR